MPAPQPIYTTNNSTYFADYGRDNMEWLCDAPYIGGAEGSINDFADCFGFLPSKIGAGYISDYYWQSSTEAQGAWRVLLFGGGAGTGGRAGGFAFEAANAWSYAKVYIGGRLCY